MTREADFRISTDGNSRFESPTVADPSACICRGLTDYVMDGAGLFWLAVLPKEGV